MGKNKLVKAYWILARFILFCSSISALAVETGSIEGYVRDAQTQEPLSGANILVVGTSLGAAADIRGKYSIVGVPKGSYTLRAIYICYKTKEIQVQIEEKTIQDILLDYEAAVQGKPVVVTAQAQGQIGAINRQLASNQIMNVVSSARIQELPDANAAESIGRLPGVSINRVGGEGTQIVIRGLAPKYNAIMIDGVRMASSNASDRSTDLSMISSTMLEGIEVSKTVTADQDADVLGGTVNFLMREAKAGKKGLGIGLLAQGGYTGLSNAYNKYNNYKFAPSIEGRFFDARLGVFMQATVERRNLTSNEFGAAYSNKSVDHINYITQSIGLRDIPRDRRRINGTLVLDYKLPAGKVSLTNFASTSITKNENRSETMNINAGVGALNQHIYSLAYSKSTLNMISNALNIEQQLPYVHADLKLSHSYSETKNPDDWAITFYQSPAGISQFQNVGNLNPKTVTEAVYTNTNNANLNTITTNNNIGKERAWTASLDLDVPVNLSRMVSSVIKFGGKYRNQKRSYGAEVYNTNATLVSPSAQGATRLIVSHFGVPTNDPTAIPLSFFVDPNFSYGKFLDGDYTMHNPMQFGLINDVVRFCQDKLDAFASAGAKEAFARNNYLSVTNNYSGEEKLSAFYAMTTINIGPKFTFIPGIRYQNLQTTYSGTRGQQTPFSYSIYNHSTDTTVTMNHPFWLPNANIRYKPFPWFDVRLSYSNTISYPDFNAIIPRIDASMGAALSWNNYKLEPSKSKNYDAYFSFSKNTLGLFTVGGFLKQIDNLIYPWTFSKPGLEAKPYYLTNKNPALKTNYTISTYVNNPYVINNWGLEFDWQAQFWYLPNPFKGLVLNVNYTHVTSKAEYPFVRSGAVSSANVDTSFIDRLIDQPNHIVNLAVGYDYKGFSIRVSMLYHDDVFTGTSQWPQLRSTTAAYQRWDISVKQNLPWFGIQLYGDVNNLNGARDMNVLQMYPDIPRTAETYGMTADIGLRWRL